VLVREIEMKPLTLRIDQFCRLVGVGKTKTYELISQKSVDTVKIGRRTLITMASAEALIEHLSDREASK
jgi:excisionase family DNA binding protein